MYFTAEREHPPGQNAESARRDAADEIGDSDSTTPITNIPPQSVEFGNYPNRPGLLVQTVRGGSI